MKKRKEPLQVKTEAVFIYVFLKSSFGVFLFFTPGL